MIATSAFYLNSIHPNTPNSISINSQFGWIYIGVLKLIRCACAYS